MARLDFPVLVRVVLECAFDEDEKYAIEYYTSKTGLRFWKLGADFQVLSSMQKALQTSVLNSWTEITELLITSEEKKGLDFDLVLIEAAYRGNITAMREAQRRGAVPTIRALTKAAEGGCIEAMREARAMIPEEKKDLYLDHVLEWAARGGHVPAMREAVSMGASDADSALGAAAFRGHIDAMKEAISMGATFAGEFLGEAAEGGHIPAMRLLYELAAAKGEVPNFNWAFGAAAIGGKIEAMREARRMVLALGQYLDLNEALVDAAGFGQLDAVKEALNLGATDLNRAIAEARNLQNTGEIQQHVIDFLQSKMR
jgi:hypothetical protein